MFDQRFSIYSDPKTQALYNQITHVHPPYTSHEQALLKQAEQKTEINSHYTHTDPTTLLNNCYLYNGIALVESQQSDAYKYKYRPYTILKATEQTKQPITEEELIQRLRNGKHKEIFYSYSNPMAASFQRQSFIKSIHLPNQYSHEANQYPPHQPNQYPAHQRNYHIEHQPSTKSLDKIKAELTENSEEKVKKRPSLVHSKDRYETKRVGQRAEKSGKISRSKKKQTGNMFVIQTEEEKYTFKTVKNRATGGTQNPKRNGNYNLFSCLDQPINKKCHNEELTCGRNQIVAPKLGSENWKK